MTHSERLSKLAPRIAAGIFLAMTLLVAVTSLRAGEITAFTWSSGVASVGLNPIAPPINPNNDDVVGPSPNPIHIHQKHYVGIGPVDIEFTVVPSGGVTEYVFIEGVQNDTGMDWTDYHIQLGYGMGAAFMPSLPGDGLDFDAPTFSSPFSFAPFSTVVVAQDDVDAYGGLVPNATFVSPFVFHVDVPDGITSFTVRQFPTTSVPEPSAVLLMATGLLVCFARRLPGGRS